MNRSSIVVIAFLLAPVVLAHGDKPHAGAHEHKQEEHKKQEHPSPHGGQVFVLDEADHLHAEVVFEESGLAVWLYDKDMKPLPSPAAAKATVVIGKEVRKLDLARAEKRGEVVDPHLAVATPLAKDAKVAVVLQLTLDGKPRSGRVERALPVPTPKP